MKTVSLIPLMLSLLPRVLLLRECISLEKILTGNKEFRLVLFAMEPFNFPWHKPLAVIRVETLLVKRLCSLTKYGSRLHVGEETSCVHLLSCKKRVKANEKLKFCGTPKV